MRPSSTPRIGLALGGGSASVRTRIGAIRARAGAAQEAGLRAVEDALPQLQQRMDF